MGDIADQHMEDYYDRLWEEDFLDALCQPPELIRCMYCKRKRFYWGETDRGWRLFTKTGKRHYCGRLKITWK